MIGVGGGLHDLDRRKTQSGRQAKTTGRGEDSCERREGPSITAMTSMPPLVLSQIYPRVARATGYEVTGIDKFPLL